MVTIVADGIFQWILCDETNIILLLIPLKFVPKGPIDNEPALVQVLMLHQTGDKPSLPESVKTDIYMWH